MAQVIVDLTGDASRLQAAYDAAEKSDKNLRDSLAATGKVGQTAAETIEREFNAAGDKSTKAFNSVLRELRKAGPEGRQVAGEIERHLQETGKAGRKSMDSIIGRLADLDPEAAKVAAAMRQHITDEATVIEAKLVKMPGPLDKFRKAAADTFGADAVKSITAYGVAVAAVTGAVKILGSGFDILKEKQDAAIESLQNQADPERRLAQIANSGADLDQMLGKADELSLKYGMSREQSRQLMFSARSEGFTEDIDEIARFGRVVDVGSQGALAGTLGRAFQGEGLSVEQRLSGVLAAAEKSAFDFETVGGSVLKSSAASKEAGSDLAETLAANATLANVIGERAGDRLSTFASKVALDPELKGMGVLGAAEALQSAPEERRRKFLGDSKELNEAYTLLTDNAAALREMTEAVRADIQASGGGGGVLRKRAEVVEGSSRFQMRENINRSEIAKEIAEEARYAEGGAKAAATENYLSAELAAQGVSTSNQGVLNFAASDLPLIGGVLPNVSLRDIAKRGGSAMGLSPETTGKAIAGAVNDVSGSAVSWLPGADMMISMLQRQTSLMERQVSATEETAANTKPGSQTPNYAAGLNSAAASAAMP